MQTAVHCEPIHVSAGEFCDDAREDDIITLAWPAPAGVAIRPGDRIFALWWRRRLSRSLEFLCTLAGELKDAPLRRRLDQELGQPPHQRIEAIRRVACPSPIKSKSVVKAHD